MWAQGYEQNHLREAKKLRKLKERSMESILRQSEISQKKKREGSIASKEL